MDYTVEIKELGRKTYLGFGRDHDFEGSIEKELELWDLCSKDGTIDKLRTLTKTDNVYGLFCYRYDVTSNRFSYHIACEVSDDCSNENAEFETLFLHSSAYAVFRIEVDGSLPKKHAYEKINDIIWIEWLPNSGYISMIEPETNASIAGTAAINIFTPFDINADKFIMEIWLPITQKAV